MYIILKKITHLHITSIKTHKRKMGSARATGVSMCIMLVIFAIFSSTSSAYQVLAVKDDIMVHCRFYIFKNIGSPFPPSSSACCQDVRGANVVNVCHDFTDQDKAKIDLWKWAAVTRVCGNALPVGTNCAGYIVH